MVKNKTCLCCLTKFSFCPDCSKKDALKPSWAGEFCSEDCMTIWSTATKYNLNKMTKAEAKSVISALALKPIEQYVKCVQRDLDIILKEEPKPKRSKKTELPVVNEVMTEASKVETLDEITHEVVKIKEE